MERSPTNSTPRAHDGHREALRVHHVARAGAVRARTAVINELKALVVTAPDELRCDLRHLTTRQLVAACAGFRSSRSRTVSRKGLQLTMRALAQRITHLNDEIVDYDHTLVDLLDEVAPQLLGEVGIGPVSAATFVLAWSHHGRCRNEAAVARLAGAAPLPATPGPNQNHHRLNYGGDRRINSALYMVAVTRLQQDPATRANMERRPAEGETKREIIRCLKRYIAHRVWRRLEHAPPRELAT
jgi:transposase